MSIAKISVCPCIFLQVNDASCLYVSNGVIWPYLSSDGVNVGEAECAKLGLSLAELTSEEETALWEVSSKQTCVRLKIDMLMD